MRDAANAAMAFAKGRSRADLDTDLMLQFAVLRALELIGEAASKLPTRLMPPTRPYRGVT